MEAGGDVKECREKKGDVRQIFKVTGIKVGDL